MLTSRLAIDLSGNAVRVVVGVPGGRMWASEAQLPPGAASHGTVTNTGEVAKVLKHVLSGAEIKETRALIAANDSLASFRVVSFARDTSEPKIDAALRSQLPMDGNRMGVQRYELTHNGGDRTVFAVAFDRQKVHGLAEAVRLAGLDPAVIELKSLCVARVAPVSDCVIVDLTVDPAEAYLISGHVPRLWHSFSVEEGDELARGLASGVRSMLAFHKRQPNGKGMPPELPVLVTDQSISERTGSAVSQMIGHPVAALPAPPRIPPDIKPGAYLACLGLLMRRR